jgi:nitrilase
MSAAGVSLLWTGSGLLMNAPSGGSSAIFGSDGRMMAEGPPKTEEGFVYAELKLDDILKAKGLMNVCGHYSQPDILWLGVDKKKKTHVALDE